MNILVHRTLQQIEFWGPGTYDVREKIKELGAAQWDQRQKKWVVRGSLLSVRELAALFPLANIEEAPEGAVSDAGVEQQGRLQLSVSQLHQHVEQAVLRSFPESVLVFGVIIKVTEGRNRTVYLELADVEDRTRFVSCRVPGNAAAIFAPLKALGFELREDLQVMFLCMLEYNTRRGSICLRVDRVVPEYTVAKVAALRDQTNKRLQAERIFTNNKNLSLPFLPRRIGIITSDRGTVIHDFLASLSRSKFAFSLVWKPVSVQGARASREIVAALRELSEQELDVLLIFRGGGSPAELNVFNDYELAKAVCLCPIPVLSAIGHQKDQTSVQDVSCLARGVPKDLGRYLSDIIIDRRRELSSLAHNIFLGCNQKYVSRCEATSRTQDSIAHSARYVVREAQRAVWQHERSLPLQMSSFLGWKRQQVTAAIVALEGKFTNALQRMDHRLQVATNRSIVRAQQVLQYFELGVSQEWRNVMSSCRQAAWKAAARLTVVQDGALRYQSLLDVKESQLLAFSQVLDVNIPERQLKKGYVMVRQRQGAIITSASAVTAGDAVNLLFHDGSHAAVIQEEDTGSSEK